MSIVSIVQFEELTDLHRWDAEAYSPFLRSLDQKFAKYPMLCELATVTHASEIPRIYTDEPDGIPFLLARNIRPFLPDLSKTVAIPLKIAESIPINKLCRNDVLVTRSGAFSGVSCIYLGENGKYYTSGEGLIVRSKGQIDGAYLVAFFNSTAGFALCQRCIYGSGQPHLAPKYLERLRIPRIGNNENKFSSLVCEASSLIQNASHLYPEAEMELLERIGWQSLREVPRELCYVENTENFVKNGRMDAEHYQPMYNRLCERLMMLGAKYIDDFCENPFRGVQPVYADGGRILVINSKHLGPTEIDKSQAERTTNEFYGRPDVSTAHLRKNDVLMYSTGAYVGRTNAWIYDNPAIASNHVTIIRPDKEVCHPLYLALFLNSPAGVSQSEQFATGSTQRELYPWYTRKILVYIPQNKKGKIDIAWQEKLANKVLTAAQAKAEARAKLDEAKRLIEEAIKK